MGRARKQQHGLPLSDGRGRSGSNADTSAIPKGAQSCLDRIKHDAEMEQVRRARREKRLAR